MDSQSGAGAGNPSPFSWISGKGEFLAVSVAPKIMDAGPFDSGCARVLPAEKEALYGFIGTDGAWRIPPRFIDAGNFSDGWAAAREPGGQWGVIDPSGKWKVQPGFSPKLENEGNGLFVIGADSSAGGLLDAARGKVFFQGKVLRVIHVGASSEKAKKILPSAVIEVNEQNDRSYFFPDGTPLINAEAVKGMAFDISEDGCLVFSEVSYSNGNQIYTVKVFKLESRSWLKPIEVTCCDPRTLPFPPRQIADGSAPYKLEFQKTVCNLEEFEANTYASLISKKGSMLYKRVFNRFVQFDGTVACVSFTAGGNALYALLDLDSGAFLVPPSAIKIEYLGNHQWYVNPYGDTAPYIYDALQRKMTGELPRFALRWMSGDLLCTDESPKKEDSWRLYAAINDDEVRIRSEASTSGEILTKLKKGTEFKVTAVGDKIEKIGDWMGLWMYGEARIRDSEDSSSKIDGWVFSAFVDLQGDSCYGP